MTFENSAPSESDPVGDVDRLSDRAFGVIEVPGRPSRPRLRGQTIMADKGLGMTAADDLLDLIGDFVDWVKIAGSTARLYRRDALRRKIAHYQEAGLKVLVAGDFLELGVVRGLADAVYAEAAELGADAIEVASAQTVVSTEVKCRLVGLAGQHGLDVFAEVGTKGATGSRPHGGWLAGQAHQLLDAGAYRVLLQGEGIVEDVAEIDEQTVLGFASSVPTDRTVFQAKEARARHWFITQLGPDVNLDVDAPDVPRLELMRRGLRERGLAGLVATTP